MLNKKEKNTNYAQPMNGLNVLSDGTELNGDLISKGDIRIDGKVTGKVGSSSKFVLGTNGKVIGDVEADSADISGMVSGNIHVSGTLFIKASGMINGDITTGKLVVEAGGQFNGQCKMGSAKIPLKSSLSDSAAAKA